MKKITCLLLVCIFVFGLVSCSSANEEVFDLDLDLDATFEADFQGAEFIIIGEQRDGRIEIDPYQEYEDSEWQERLKNRYKEIESKYNLKFVFKTRTIDLVSAHAGGMKWADLYDARADGHWPNINAGLYNALTDVPGFVENIESGKWGSVAAVEYFKRGDDYYGFYPGYQGIPFPAMGGILYSNLTLVGQYGFNPYEMIEDGTWTWDGFENILRTIGGSPSNLSIGTPVGMYIGDAFYEYFQTAAILNNGGSLVKTDSEGRLVSNFDSKEVREAIEWVRSLVSEGIVEFGQNDIKYDYFMEDLLGFVYEYSYVGTVDTSGFMYNDVDFAILPCPAGPSAEYGKWSAYLGLADRYLTVPITADMEIVNTILDELYAPLGDDSFEWRDVYANRNFLHEESADLYWQMYDNAQPDYYLATQKFQWSSVLRGTTTVTAAIDATKDSIQEALDKNFNDFVK